MTPHDLKVLLNIMAFTTVVIMEDGPEASDGDKKVKMFAALLEKWITEHVPAPVAIVQSGFAEEAGATEIDTAINQHIKNLRQREVTRLPDDREMLIKYYDRLQMRKSRRMQRDLYAKVTVDKLADMVLKHLDEEIDDAESLS